MIRTTEYLEYIGRWIIPDPEDRCNMTVVVTDVADGYASTGKRILVALAQAEWWNKKYDLEIGWLNEYGKQIKNIS